MKTQMSFNRNYPNQDNFNESLPVELQQEAEQMETISFQKKVDDVIRQITHAKHVSNKDRCRDLLNEVSFILNDYNTFNK